jgi:metallo-beta-lactamase family protein
MAWVRAAIRSMPHACEMELGSMKITSFGAAGGEVIGSAYLVQTAAANVVVDCGVFQGSQKLENSNRLPATKALERPDAVVLTHAYLDHPGRLPLLARFDYKAPIEL